VYILCECERSWLHSDIHIWVLPFGGPEDIRKLSKGGPSGTLLKEQVSFNLV